MTLVELKTLKGSPEYVVFELVEGRLVEPMNTFNRFDGGESGFAERAANDAACTLSNRNPEKTYTVLPIYGEK